MNPYTQRLQNTQLAELLIKEAYKLLKEAGAVHATARVRGTLKSVQGAVRHADRLTRTPGKFQVKVHRRKQRTIGEINRQSFAEMRRAGIDV